MSTTNILLTCIGGVYGLDLIEAFRADQEYPVRIIGVDANAETVNRFFVDEFYPVPSAGERQQDFINALFDIAEKGAVSCLIPGADEEVLALSRARKRFSDAGVVCTVEDASKIELMRDKAALFQHLSSRGIPLPDYAIVSEVDDIVKAAEKLDYPKQKFILKPRTGRGARGLIIIDSHAVGYSVIPSTRNYVMSDLPSAVERLLQENSPLNLMAMEYLPGPAYDVDCITDKGSTLQMVVRKRLWKDPFSPVSQGCQVVARPDMETQAREIAAALELSYAFDFDFGTTADGRPGLLELNPRMSGAVASARSAGVNIPLALLRYASGLSIPASAVALGKAMFPVTRMAFVDWQE